jgi:hypothetical protein
MSTILKPYRHFNGNIWPSDIYRLPELNATLEIGWHLFKTVCYLSIYQYGFLVEKDNTVGCQTINIICTFNIDKSYKKNKTNKTDKQTKKKKKNKTQITKTTPVQEKKPLQKSNNCNNFHRHAHIHIHTYIWIYDYNFLMSKIIHLFVMIW